MSLWQLELNDTLLAIGRGRVGSMALWAGPAHGWRAPVVHDSACNSPKLGGTLVPGSGRMLPWLCLPLQPQCPHL